MRNNVRLVIADVDGTLVTQDKVLTPRAAARSQPYYLDVTHPDANKGHVVAVLSEALSIPPAPIATIGDMPNDVLMFQKSSSALPGGTPALKCNGRRDS